MRGAGVVLGVGLVVENGLGGGLVARGAMGVGVRALEGMADGDCVLRVLQYATIAFGDLGADPSALDGLHDALVSPGLLEYVKLAFGVVLDWPCWRGGPWLRGVLHLRMRCEVVGGTRALVQG